ncbi:MAG: Cof-type HAD-IIB family hydrolase [Lawsonibacter sp.]|nr:Cof-type HAD-IIB family hydrolase [Lawsonibacter sp.]
MSFNHSQVRLIALDLDGTLMEDDHLTISERNCRAIRAVAAQGVQVVLASGRARSMMEDVAETLGCVHWMITSNGAVVVDRGNGAVLRRAEIPADRGAQVLCLFLKYPLPIEVYCGGHVYVKRGSWSMKGYTKQPPAFLQMRKTLNREVDDLSKELAGRAVEKFNVDGIDVDSRDEILTGISGMSDLTYTYVSAYDNLEINHCHATKGEALRGLCKVLRIPQQAVMAFGDSSNDVQMLCWAGWPFAMGNAAPEARQAARFRTGTNTQSGVAQVLETCFLS